MRKRWLWFWILLVASIGITVAGTVLLKSPFLALFLFLPLGPLLFGARGDGAAQHPPRACLQCGFETTETWIDHCPRDGSKLAPAP